MLAPEKWGQEWTLYTKTLSHKIKTKQKFSKIKETENKTVCKNLCREDIISKIMENGIKGPWKLWVRTSLIIFSGHCCDQTQNQQCHTPHTIVLNTYYKTAKDCNLPFNIILSDVCLLTYIKRDVPPRLLRVCLTFLNSLPNCECKWALKASQQVHSTAAVTRPRGPKQAREESKPQTRSNLSSG